MRITDICDILRKELYNNDYEYGFYLSGKKYKPDTALGFDEAFNELLHTVYIVQNPSDTMRKKIGTCMDEVVLMEAILADLDVPYKIWLLYNRLKNRVHTVLTFEAEGKTVYLELTPQYKKPWYGKEIVYDSNKDFIADYNSQNYDVLDITGKIKAGVSPMAFLPNNYKVIRHYDKLIYENNDPVHDPEPLKCYMDKWDGLTLIDLLRLENTKTVLEIGVGTGRLAVRVAPRCKSFCGIDISPKTIERAKLNLVNIKNVHLICDDFLIHKFELRFDVVYSSLTFMHFIRKQEAIDKAARLLNNNGRFVLSIDKNSGTVIDIGTNKIPIFPDTPEEIEKCIGLAGMKLSNRIETEFAYIFVAVKE